MDGPQAEEEEVQDGARVEVVSRYFKVKCLNFILYHSRKYSSSGGGSSGWSKGGSYQL